MGIVRPVNYSKKELAGLSDVKKKKLRTAILGHLDKHKGIRKIVRQKTKSLYTQLKKD